MSPELTDLPLTKLNEDGTINCRNCGLMISFLPPLEPDTPQASVNHTGCPMATPDESPAGPDAHTGLHETINRIDPEEVRAFYARKSA